MSEQFLTTYPFWMLLINQLAVYGLIGLVTWAAFNDVKEYKIPNKLVLYVIALYIPFVFTSPENINILNSLMAFGIILVVGFLIFAVGIIGAGDIKLFAALGLWSGTVYLADMFIVLAFTGGALALVYLVYLLAQKFTGLQQKSYKPKAIVLPYGVAIAGGAYFLAYQYLEPLPLGIIGA